MRRLGAGITMVDGGVLIDQQKICQSLGIPCNQETRQMVDQAVMKAFVQCFGEPPESIVILQEGEVN